MTDQPPTAVILPLDEAHRDDVVTALREQAERYRRAGVRAAGEAADDRRRTGKDIRTRAVRVVEVLALADTLAATATRLEEAELVKLAVPRPGIRAVTALTPPDDPSDDGDEEEEAGGGRDGIEPGISDDDIAAAMAASTGPLDDTGDAE